MASSLEQLRWIGNFNLKFTWQIDQVDFRYVGGVCDPAITVGHPDGDYGMALVFSTLPAAQAQFIDPGADLGGPQSRADYIWNFFRRHKLNGNKPFIVEFAAPGSNNVAQQFEMRFTDKAISYELVMCALYTSGLQLEQARPRNASGGDVPFENPLTM